MKKFLSFKTMALSLFLNLFVLVQVWALNIVEIEETEFSRGKTHKVGNIVLTSPTQVRLIDFDVTNQRFEQIVYLMTPKDDVYTYVYKGISIKFQRDKKTNKLAIDIEKGLPDKDTWFVAQESLFSDTDAEISGVPDETREDRAFVRNPGETFLPADRTSLLKEFENIKERSARKKSPMQAEFISTEEPFTYDITGQGALFTLVGQNPHDTETGELGELAADLTFFAHGFTKKASKIGGDKNNGFDGIYVLEPTDPAQRQVWVVEAKFHNPTKSENYFDKEFSGKLAKGGALEKYRASKDKELIKTGTLIDGFKKDQPKQIFFLGYDVMSDGRVRTPFVRSYSTWFPPALPLLTKDSSPQDRKAFLETAIGSYVDTSPKKQSPLALAKRLLEAAGLTGIKVEKED
jgi:hypothetical protein